MLNFDRSTVKHGTQNIQSDCHQWLSDSFRVHQIRFRPGLHPGPHWRAYGAPPYPLAGLRGSTSKGEGKGREEGERKEPPPFANSWIRPWEVGVELYGAQIDSDISMITNLHSFA